MTESFPVQERKALQAGQVFSPSAPIDKAALFAGRTTQLRQVVDAVNQRGQHAIIYGERGVGKTSLANVLSDSLHAPGGQIIAPHVNCDSGDTFSSLWRKIFQEIQLFTERREIGFQSTIYQKVTSISETLTHDISSADVRRTLALISQQALLVIILDEFDRLRDESVRALFADTVKMLSDLAVPATIVIVGVADTVEDLIREHHSIERALIQVPMPRMSSEELSEIIDKGLARLQMEIEPDARDRIVALSRGLPHYTHLLSRHATRDAIDAGELLISADHVESAIAKSLDDAQQSIRSAYHVATSSAQTDNLYAEVLLACAMADTDEMGYFAPADVREPMSRIMGKPYDIPNFQRHLNDFSSDKRGHILQRSGTPHRYRYRFRNPLMQPFVLMQGYVSRRIIPK